MTVAWLTACGAPGAAPGPLNIKERDSGAFWDGSAVYRVGGQRLAFAGAVFRGPAHALDPTGAMVSKRCLALAQGIPYLVAPEVEVMTSDHLQGELVSIWASDEASARAACPTAFGAGWRLPTSAEASFILERRLSVGAAQAILVSREGGALALTFTRSEGAVIVAQREDGLGSVFCVAPAHLLPPAQPERSEIARCIDTFSAESFGLEPQEVSALVDATQLDLIALVQQSCRQPNRAATASIVERLNKLSGTATLGSHLGELQSALQASERTVAGIDGALHAVSEIAPPCERLPVVYAQKCPGSCLEIQAQYAAHCSKLDPLPRLSAALERERGRLAQVRTALRRQRTLVLAASRAVQCAKGDSEARLRHLLQSGGRVSAAQGSQRCELADLECGLSAVQGL